MRAAWLAGVFICVASPVLAQHGQPDLAILGDNPVSRLISVPFRFSYHMLCGQFEHHAQLLSRSARNLDNAYDPVSTQFGLFSELPVRAFSSVSPIIAAVKTVGFPGSLAFCTAAASVASATARLASSVEGGTIHGRHHHRYHRHGVTRKHFGVTCPGIAAHVSNVLTARKALCLGGRTKNTCHAARGVRRSC